MSSNSQLNACLKCPKGFGQVLCGGCQRWFCMKHLYEHRAELSQKMEDLSHQHDQLQQDLMIESDDDSHPLLTRLNRWELNSIERIQKVAHEARCRLKESLDELKRNAQERLHEITYELQDSREKEAYTEIDLNRWMNQFKEIREELEKPSTIEIKYDDDEPTSKDIRIIQLRIFKQNRVPSYINGETRWSIDGQTVAGGHERGVELNQLHRPASLDINDDGELYVADWGNDRLVRWTPNAQQGEIIAGGKGRENQNDPLNDPVAVLIDQKNDCLFISEEGNRRVIRNSQGTNQEILTNIRSLGLAMDVEGSLYVSDFEKHEVRRYGLKDPKDGQIVAGGNGQGDALNQLHCPRQIFVTDDRSIYVSDMWNHRVIKWTKNACEGIVVAGGQGEGKDLDQLNKPSGIFVDRMGSVYVVDQGNHRLMRWLLNSKEGEMLMGFNGKGSLNNQFNQPSDVAIDNHGHLYVVDTYNDRIQQFNIQ